MNTAKDGKIESQNADVLSAEDPLKYITSYPVGLDRSEMMTYMFYPCVLTTTKGMVKTVSMAALITGAGIGRSVTVASCIY